MREVPGSIPVIRRNSRVPPLFFNFFISAEEFDNFIIFHFILDQKAGIMTEAPPSYDAALAYPTVPSIPQYQYSHPPPQSQGHRTQSSNITRPKMGEVRLFEGSNERRRHEELGDLYAIIKVTESLEAAYSRDAITTSEYSEACTRLLAQFKSTESALITGGMITSAEVFMREYDIDCPRGIFIHKSMHI